MNLGELMDKLTSGDIPAEAMAAVGIVLLLIAWRTARRSLRIFWILAALVLFAGAVWWHLHRR